MAVCNVCFRHCDLREGQVGACRARACIDGHVVSTNYGRITSIALDPIEKKPLSRFYPGSSILSVGSYGCNLFCPFCQNHDISRSDGSEFSDTISPEQLERLSVKYKDSGNIGVAFTYNEPLVGFEFVRDTARLIHETGMKNVLVTNGTCEPEISGELLSLIDAVNVDIKSMSDKTYRDVLGGDLTSVKRFIEECAGQCHVELTMLIVPGMNDSEDEMRQLADWIAGIDDEIPLHITRFFPRYRMCDRQATEVALIRRLVSVARQRLKYVYAGNC